MKASCVKVAQITALTVMFVLLISVAAFSATASVLVTKDGAQQPGGSWYDYYNLGWVTMMYSNDFCTFYADVVPVITAPGMTTTVNSAELVVYTYSNAGVLPASISTYTGNTPWDEATGPFMGWDNTYASTTITGDGRWHLDVTQMVQDWVNGAPNNGMGLLSQSGHSASIVTREAVGWDGALPVFNIDYTQTAVPEPGALLALCTGLIGMGAFASRRRK